MENGVDWFRRARIYLHIKDDDDILNLCREVRGVQNELNHPQSSSIKQPTVLCTTRRGKKIILITRYICLSRTISNMVSQKCTKSIKICWKKQEARCIAAAALIVYTIKPDLWKRKKQTNLRFFFPRNSLGTWFILLQSINKSNNGFSSWSMNRAKKKNK